MFQLLTGIPYRLNSNIIVLSSTSTTSWTVPDDWANEDNCIICIGCGGSTNRDGDTATGGGGGGACAWSNNVTLVPGATVNVKVGNYVSTSSVTNGDGSDGWASWFNATTAANGKTATVHADGGKENSGDNGGAGGITANCIGQFSFKGGNGGTALDGEIDKQAGGGGGAGGMDAAGVNGSNGSGSSTGGAGGAGNGGLNGGGPGAARQSNAVDTATNLPGGTVGSGGGGGGGDTNTVGGDGGNYGGGAGGHSHEGGGQPAGTGVIVIRYTKLEPAVNIG